MGCGGSRPILVAVPLPEDTLSMAFFGVDNIWECVQYLRSVVDTSPERLVAVQSRPAYAMVTSHADGSIKSIRTVDDQAAEITHVHKVMAREMARRRKLGLDKGGRRAGGGGGGGGGGGASHRDYARPLDRSRREVALLHMHYDLLRASPLEFTKEVDVTLLNVQLPLPLKSSQTQRRGYLLAEEFILWVHRVCTMADAALINLVYAQIAMAEALEKVARRRRASEGAGAGGGGGAGASAAARRGSRRASRRFGDGAGTPGNVAPGSQAQAGAPSDRSQAGSAGATGAASGSSGVDISGSGGAAARASITSDAASSEGAGTGPLVSKRRTSSFSHAQPASREHAPAVDPENLNPSHVIDYGFIHRFFRQPDPRDPTSKRRTGASAADGAGPLAGAAVDSAGASGAVQAAGGKGSAAYVHPADKALLQRIEQLRSDQESGSDRRAAFRAEQARRGAAGNGGPAREEERVTGLSQQEFWRIVASTPAVLQPLRYTQEYLQAHSLENKDWWDRRGAFIGLTQSHERALGQSAGELAYHASLAGTARMGSSVTEVTSPGTVHASVLSGRAGGGSSGGGSGFGSGRVPPPMVALSAGPGDGGGSPEGARSTKYGLMSSVGSAPLTLVAETDVPESPAAVDAPATGTAFTFKDSEDGGSGDGGDGDGGDAGSASASGPVLVNDHEGPSGDEGESGSDDATTSHDGRSAISARAPSTTGGGRRSRTSHDGGDGRAPRMDRFSVHELTADEAEWFARQKRGSIDDGDDGDYHGDDDGIGQGGGGGGNGVFNGGGDVDAAVGRRVHVAPSGSGGGGPGGGGDSPEPIGGAVGGVVSDLDGDGADEGRGAPRAAPPFGVGETV